VRDKVTELSAAEFAVDLDFINGIDVGRPWWAQPASGGRCADQAVVDAMTGG
jgi:hypothetical protein